MTAIATVEMCDLSKAEQQSALRRKLELVEKVLKTLPQIEIPLRHFFINGALAREMTMPKDGLWIGKTHKYDQINFLLKGDMSVLIDGVMRRVQAPYTYVAPSGTKRAGFAHEDSVWTCVVSTPGRLLSEDDRDEIDAFFVAESDDDYQRFLAEQGFTDERARELTEDSSDQVDDQQVYELLELRPSPIDGHGLFARRGLQAGQFVAIARRGTLRTPAGRWINHSPDPNGEFYYTLTGDIALRTIAEIPCGTEVTVDYRHQQLKGVTP